MNIAIIGGGISGLTTALVLQKLNIKATIFERAEALNEIGAGIWLQPNAMKVLNWLGLGEKIKSKGIQLNRMDITDQMLFPFKQIDDNIVADEEGNKTLAIHRARLQKFLYDQLKEPSNFVLNKAFKSYEFIGDQVKLTFQDGRTDLFDFVIAADGINSLVRNQMISNASLRSAEQICWRGIANFDLPDEFKSLGREAWGRGKRFGFSQIYDGEVYWFAVSSNSKHLKPAADKDVINVLINLFADFNPIIADIIGHTDSNKVHVAELKDLKRLDSWFDNNICLIGDAAHATTPNMGQGACQGMEDAYFLGSLIAENLENPKNAFMTFEQKRRPKVDYVVQNSWRFGKMAHSSIGQLFMKTVMKLTPLSVLNKSMNRLYSLDSLK